MFFMLIETNFFWHISLATDHRVQTVYHTPLTQPGLENARARELKNGPKNDHFCISGPIWGPRRPMLSLKTSKMDSAYPKNRKIAPKLR